MAKKLRTFKDLANRLDRTSAFFLVGAAMLEPYIDMGQPRVSQSSDSAHETPSAQPSSPSCNAADLTDYAALPPHEQYGNIYYPYHIEQTASWRSHLRYRVVHADGEITVSSASWSEAREVARWLNSGERPPAVDIIIARRSLEVI